MTPDDLPDNDTLAHTDYRCNIVYRYPNGSRVDRYNVRLKRVLWLREGLMLMFNFGDGWCDLEFRWKNLLRIERVKVEA